MSQQDSASPEAAKPQVPTFNIYTSTLLIALVSLLIGVVVLLLELRGYGGFPFEWAVWKPTG